MQTNSSQKEGQSLLKIRQVIKRSNQDKRSTGHQKSFGGSQKSAKLNVSARSKKSMSRFATKKMQLLSDSISTGEGEDGDAAEELALSLCASASHSEQETEGQFDQCLDMLQDCPSSDNRMPLSQPVVENSMSIEQS